MTPSNDISFVLSVNDLESAAIWELLAGRNHKGLVFDSVINLQAGWGQSGRLTKDQFKSLRHTVVLIEIHDPEMEQLLRGSGRQVILVDHHLYQADGDSLSDRRNGRSSLEQIQLLLDLHPADDSENSPALPAYLSPASVRSCLTQSEITFGFRDLAAWISANDRGHIPNLSGAIRDSLKNWKTDTPEGHNIGKEAFKREADCLVPCLVRDIRLRDMTIAREIGNGIAVAALADMDRYSKFRDTTEATLNSDLLPENGTSVNYRNPA